MLLYIEVVSRSTSLHAAMTEDLADVRRTSAVDLLSYTALEQSETVVLTVDFPQILLSLSLIGLHSLGTVMANTLVHYLFMAFKYSDVCLLFSATEPPLYICVLNSLGTVMATNSDRFFFFPHYLLNMFFLNSLVPSSASTVSEQSWRPSVIAFLIPTSALTQMLTSCEFWSLLFAIYHVGTVMATNCTCPSEDQTSIDGLHCTSAFQRLQQHNICKGAYTNVVLR